MANLECEKCGGTLRIAVDKKSGVCEYCGSKKFFSGMDDEKRVAAFNRGNHFRHIAEFDKALMVYERVVQEDENDAEAHWCCALCRFGIEYIKDPKSGEWMPTCHRASFDSFMEDVDVQAAIQHSSGAARRQYEQEAAKIAEVQKGILAVSQNEEPFDVFICYKETEENGTRTRDSVLAQEIYYQLTDQGRRVFFAPITLAEKAGREYEPYIFAALNSAKVMVVVGTTAAHLNAVWVKNEWSRYMALMKRDHSRLLIPCYRDMDPYDMPEQLSVLQSYDMSRIGFMQDLTRGIAKVLDVDKVQPAAVQQTTVIQAAENGSNMNALLKRGWMALEDGEWDRASEFFDQVLNQNAECAEAYVGMMFADRELKNWQDAERYWCCPQEADRIFIKLECPEIEAFVKQRAKELAIPGYLSEEYFLKGIYGADEQRKVVEPGYYSILASRKEQRDNSRWNMEHDKYFNKAVKFSEGSLKKKLLALQEKSERSYEIEIARVEALEKAEEERARKRYKEFIADADDRAVSRNKAARARQEAEEEEEERKAKNMNILLIVALVIFVFIFLLVSLERASIGFTRTKI